MCTQLFDPKIDFVFKSLFGNAKHPNILLSFLNACITSSAPIVSAQIKNSEINKEHIEDSFSRLDVLAKTDSGELINIEMQRLDERNMVKRSLYYWAKTYSSEYTGKSRYQDLPRTICINVLDFNLLQDAPHYHNVYQLKNQDNLALEPVLELQFIELPKLTQLNETDLLTLWAGFLQDPNNAQVIHAEKNISALGEAREELARISRDPAQAELYRMRENAQTERIRALLSAKVEGHLAGLAEGIEKGIAEGIEKGIAQGQADGEQKKALEIAKRLLALGLDFDQITLATGLIAAEIEKLKK
ncbi:MAG: Rpn family recombination-promoting nuclease/putative transposase [Aeromonas sp.]